MHVLRLSKSSYLIAVALDWIRLAPCYHQRAGVALAFSASAEEAQPAMPSFVLTAPLLPRVEWRTSAIAYCCLPPSRDTTRETCFSHGGTSECRSDDAPAEDDFIAIACDGGHSVGLRANGTLVSWD